MNGLVLLRRQRVLFVSIGVLMLIVAGAYLWTSHQTTSDTIPDVAGAPNYRIDPPNLYPGSTGPYDTAAVTADESAGDSSNDVKVSKPAAEQNRPTTDRSKANVKLAAGSTKAELSALGKRLGFRVDTYLPAIGWAGIEAVDGSDINEGVLDEITKSNLASEAEPSVIFYTSTAPTDPRYAGQWGFKNTGQTGGTAGADMNAETAWDRARGDDVVVAVIDEGVMTSHPDLANQIWVNGAEQAGAPGVDDDGNGFVDDVNGWDFAHDDATVYDEYDGDMHGTHVAGTVGAQANNGLDGVGTAWNAKIMPVKGLAMGSGNDMDLAAAIIYAANNGAQIANNSWGSSVYSAMIAGAVDYAESKGMLMVCAAGNSGQNADSTPQYPAALSNENIISVANLTSTDALATSSNYGATSVDIGAPGTGILSTKSRSSAGVRVEATATGGTAPYSLYYYPMPVERITSTSVRDSIISTTMTSLSPTKSSPILIVDDSWRGAFGDPNYASTVYQSVLAAQGYSNVTIWDTSVSGTPVLTSYAAVIWFTGRMSYPLWQYVMYNYGYPTTTYTFASAERTNVETYLKAGGNIMISSPEMGGDLDYWFGGMSPQVWYRTYTKAALFDDTHQQSFVGVPSGPFDGASSTIPVVMAAPYTVGDEIIARPGSTSVLNWSAQMLSISGTSMASPHVAGVAALALSRTPDATYTDLRSRILDTAKSIPALTGKCATGGKLDAAEAVGLIEPPTNLATTITAWDKASVTWTNNDIDAYFDKTRVLMRDDVPVESVDDAAASVVYEGTAEQDALTELTAGTYYLSAFSANSLGVWSEETTAVLTVTGQPLDVQPANMDAVANVRFTNWDSLGSVEATQIALPSAAPTGMQLVAGTSWDLTTSVQFSGQSYVTMPYSDAGLTAEQEAGVKLFHYAQGSWVDITDAVNTTSNTASGYTSSFSPFAVFVPLGAEPPEPPMTVTSSSSAWSIVLLAIVGLSIAGYLRGKQLG